MCLFIFLVVPIQSCSSLLCIRLFLVSLLVVFVSSLGGQLGHVSIPSDVITLAMTVVTLRHKILNSNVTHR